MLAEAQSAISPLDRAIAAAEAYLPTYHRLSAAHDAAEEAMPRWDEALNARRQAARAAVPRPDCLTFKRAPADEITYMEIRYADGAVKKIDGLGSDFTPDTRDTLAKHCEEKQLEAKPYLDEWDLWQAQMDEAEDIAGGPEVRALEIAFEKAEAAWERALTRRMRLSAAILKAPVSSPEEALAQIEAYRKIEEVKDLSDLFDEDKTTLLKAAVRALESLGRSAEPQRKAA